MGQRQYSVAGKVTIGLASYRPCVTGSVDLAAFSAVNVVTDEYLAMKSPPRG